MTIYNITFSPTGGTRRVAEILIKEFGTKPIDIELCVPENELIIPEFSSEDICLISVPSFGGRVPQIAINRIELFNANGAKAVLVCVYGNRAYEDTLTELKDTAERVGFQCFAAISALSEHSIVREIAKGRPDSNDETVLKDFSKQIIGKINNCDFKLNSSIPGNHTYKEHSKSKSVPETYENCIGCKKCASACPVSAIDFDNPQNTNAEKCVSCMKCVSVCPANARGLNKDVIMAISEKLGKICIERKQNELFV